MLLAYLEHAGMDAAALEQSECEFCLDMHDGDTLTWWINDYASGDGWNEVLEERIHRLDAFDASLRVGA